MSEIVGIDPGGEMSGVAFEQTPEAPGGLGSFLGSVGGMFGPGGMPPMDLSSSAKSRAVSGGPFESGDITFGLKTNTLIIGAAAVVLGLFLLFWRK